MTDDLDDLTLKDIKAMVTILEEFIRTSRRVENILARYGKHQGIGLSRFSVDDVVASVMARQQANTVDYNVEDEISDEDAKRVLAKIKSMNKQ
jgi:hypothetical protein